MKYLRLFLLTLVLIYLSVDAQTYDTSIFDKNGEIYFKFELNLMKDMEDITKIISIDNRDGNTIYAYANEKEFNHFLNWELAYSLLPHPNEGFNPTMATFKQIQNSDTWDYYPTYDAYVALMYQFEADYPNICDVFSIGQSVEGRELLVAKISDNVNTDENEPEFLYTSSMHGDELTGFPIMLNLIDSLLANYGTVSRMTNLVNNIEIYINPLANPDGTYAGGNNSVSGATRSNANGVDLNRNYPDPEDGPHPDGNAWQTETIHFMNFAENRDFVMSANFHGGTEVCNYPWDTWSTLAADDIWWQYVCHEYADTAQAFSPSNYMNGYDDGITNGYAWYTISGGRQDYMNYFQQCRELTLEISDTKLIPASQLEAHWQYNKRSVLNYLEQCLFGIRGIVTDAVSGLPIEAEIYILNHEADSSQVFSSLPAGNYHRLVHAGTYDVQVSAPCFETQIISGVSVMNKNTTYLDIQLSPITEAVDFTANSTNIGIGESTDFMDLSCGNPTSWQWTFEGGTPSTSTLQNPSNIIYNTGGTYFVKLIISNGTYSDSITKMDYITVSEEYLMTNGTFTTCAGTFYDSGGQNNEYSNYEDYTMTFYPNPPNGKIKVDFTMFSVEFQSTCDYDWLMIYDGPDYSAPIIGEYCGTNSPGTVLSTHETGSLTFVFHSDYSVTEPGWAANISCEIEQIELDLKVFLEGPFSGALMNTYLNTDNLIPLSQPFNTAPWNYAGTESVASIPNTDVVDWILIELRDTTDASLATGGTMIAQQAAFLLNDGSVVDLDGSSILSFIHAINQSLFVAIWHRNHLGIMSAYPVTQTAGVYTYDFTTPAGQAFGINSQKDLGSGNYGMISSDSNGDGNISIDDKTSWESHSGTQGYKSTDFDMDGQINNSDKNEKWLPNEGAGNQVPD